MMKIVIFACAVIGLTLGYPEKPAPYAPKGWKPQGARLELPREYGPPKGAETTTVANEYLPPTTEVAESDENDYLRVQSLPAVDSVSQFNTFKDEKKQSAPRVEVKVEAARIQIAPAPAFIGQPILFSPLFAPQFAPVNEQLREEQLAGQQQQFNGQQSNGQQQFNGQTIQQQFNGPQQFNQQQQQFSQQQADQQQQEFDNPKNDAQQLPPQAYGPPPTANTPKSDVPQSESPQDSDPNEPNNNDYDENREDESESDAPAIAVSNAVSDSQQGQNGQYYILLPDSSLQKVRFATKQTEEDRQINGFSAQLRYSPVEAIRDPVYGYDEQGKIVRLYK